MIRLSVSGRGRTKLAAEEQCDVAAVAFPSELGWMALAYRGDTLLGLVFGHAAERNACVALRRVVGEPDAAWDVLDADDCPAAIRDLCHRLQRFAAGESVDFRDVAVDERHLMRFGRRVVAACRRIAFGKTRSYGELAATSGSPGAARAVGQVMASNRYPLVVPCHRVVGAGGSLGGFSAPQGLAMKRRLLSLEKEPNSAVLRHMGS